MVSYGGEFVRKRALFSSSYRHEDAMVGENDDYERQDEAEDEDGEDVAAVGGVCLLPHHAARDPCPLQHVLVPANEREGGPQEPSQPAKPDANSCNLPTEYSPRSDKPFSPFDGVFFSPVCFEEKSTYIKYVRAFH